MCVVLNTPWRNCGIERWVWPIILHYAPIGHLDNPLQLVDLTRPVLWFTGAAALPVRGVEEGSRPALSHLSYWA